MKNQKLFKLFLLIISIFLLIPITAYSAFEPTIKLSFQSENFLINREVIKEKNELSPEFSEALTFERDINGTINAVYDQNGILKERYIYDAFGTPLNCDYNSMYSELRFHGKLYFAELGLYYFNARFFDPRTASFISPDPADIDLNDPFTFANKYAFCNNNPWRYSDPKGLFNVENSETLLKSNHGKYAEYSWNYLKNTVGYKIIQDDYWINESYDEKKMQIEIETDYTDEEAAEAIKNLTKKILSKNRNNRLSMLHNYGTNASHNTTQFGLLGDVADFNCYILESGGIFNLSKKQEFSEDLAALFGNTIYGSISNQTPAYHSRGIYNIERSLLFNRIPEGLKNIYVDAVTNRSNVHHFTYFLDLGTKNKIYKYISPLGYYGFAITAVWAADSPSANRGDFALGLKAIEAANSISFFKKPSEWIKTNLAP